MRRFYPYTFLVDLLAVLREVDPHRMPPPRSFPRRYQDVFNNTCRFLTSQYSVPTAANSPLLFEVQDLVVWFQFTKACLVLLRDHFEDEFDELRSKHRDVTEDNLGAGSMMEYSNELEPIMPQGLFPLATTDYPSIGNTIEGSDGGVYLKVELTEFDFTAMHHVYEAASNTLKARGKRKLESTNQTTEWMTGLDEPQYNYPIYLLWVASDPEAADGVSFYNFQVVSEYIRADVVRAVVTNARVKKFMNQQKECMTMSLQRGTWNTERLVNNERLRVIVDRRA